MKELCSATLDKTLDEKLKPFNRWREKLEKRMKTIENKRADAADEAVVYSIIWMQLTNYAMYFTLPPKAEMLVLVSSALCGFASFRS